MGVIGNIPGHQKQNPKGLGVKADSSLNYNLGVDPESFECS